MVTFAKTSSPRLYAAAAGGAAGDIWIAYWLPATHQPPPATIDLAEALNGLPGSFVLAAAGAGHPIDDQAEAIAAAVAAAVAVFPGKRAIAWLSAPKAPSTATIRLLGLSDNGSTINVALPVPLVDQRFYFTVNGSLAVAIAGDSLVFTVPAGFQNGLYFSTAIGTVGAFGQAKTATLPLSGNDAGALLFSSRFQRATLAGTLNWGMQLLYTDPDGAPGNFRSQLYPFAESVLDPSDTIGFAVRLDPSDVANRQVTERTLFTFEEAADGKPATLASGYRTAWGDRIDLVPVTAAADGEIPAGLVLTVGNPGTPGGAQFALAPRGDFVLHVPPPKHQVPQPLLCGLTSTETITFTPGIDRLRFLTGRCAFASGYPPAQASALGPPVDTSVAPMTDRFLTSWATVIAGPAKSDLAAQKPGIHYSAQPRGQPLFGLDEVVAPAAPGTLGPVDPGYILPHAPDFAVPLMPYGLALPTGLPTGFDSNAVAAVEARIVAPRRRTAIGGPDSTITSIAPHHRRAALLADGATSIQATTPMGLVATVDSEGRWDGVGLALNAEAGVRLGFCKPPPALQQALQSSELFLVIANAGQLGTLTGWNPAGSMAPPADPPSFFNAMNVADWRIEARVGSNAGYGDYSNVMIVKGCRGSVTDLVTRTSAWTQAGTFAAPSYPAAPAAPVPGDVVALSTWLNDYIAAARARLSNAEDRRYFQNFIDIVDSTTWTGILVLKASLTQLPADLGGLLATIDPAYAFAHHFGVSVSPVDAATVSVNRTSAMFQLVDYVEPGYVDAAATTAPMAPQGTGPYDFQLLTMKALFENSAVAAFSSKAQLTLGAWFGDSVGSMKGAEANSYNTIFLIGSYQSQHGRSGYVLDCETSNKFLLDSDAIAGIEVVKAQYVSIDDQDSRFDIWGFIDFALIGGTGTPFDIFSFGGSAGVDDPPRTGLSFSGLALGMSVDSAQNKTFAPDHARMAFDVARSTPRPGSLYRDFALRPPAIVIGAADAGPLDRGYLTVGSTAPTLTGVGQGKAWFGLSFGLDMGSIGALAGGAGLTATMLCAWAPKASGGGAASDGSAFPVQLGLALPGVNPTAKLMSLEGVLRLGIGELSITHAPVATPDGTASTEPYWVLSLDDIGLKFLGFYKIPPSGSISFTCFGNPGAAAGPSALGWYAVYNQTPPAPGGIGSGSGGR